MFCNAGMLCVVTLCASHPINRCLLLHNLPWRGVVSSVGSSIVNTLDQQSVLFEQLSLKKLLEEKSFPDFTKGDLSMIMSEAEKFSPYSF
jgi:hypothetical protein